MALTEEELTRRHKYHPPRPGTDDAGNHQALREEFRFIALWVNVFLERVAPNSPREAACVQTALEEASFWAHAALARSRAE